MSEQCKMKEPIVTVQQGKLRGKICKDVNGGKFFGFQGIPYAKPPIGDLRFKPAQPAEPWPGIRDATAEGNTSICVEFLFGNVVGSEDCLFLNVYTPQLPNNNNDLKSVMVWIHGGGFTSGSSKTDLYGPEFLIKEDIVFVSINYRLGILGFLSLEDLTLGVPGNNGLKDMVVALKWIQKNISQFGGDPNNVTIFGESCGSAACNFLMMSPTAKGLFHRAIMQSGSILSTWAYGRRNAIHIAQVLGHACSTEKEALEFLKKVPAMKFTQAQTIIKDCLYQDNVRPFCPVIEKPNPDAFLTEHPLDIIRSGNYNQVPVIMGYTNNEGIFVELFNESTEYRMTNFEHAIPYHYNLPKGTKESLALAKNIEEFYYGKSKGPKDDREIFYRLGSDTFFLRGIQTEIKAFLKTLNASIYFYRFSVDASLNLLKKYYKSTAKGACHADDLGYLFTNKIFSSKLEPNSVEAITVHRMIKWWTNFAKTGNPNPKEQDPLMNIEWPATTKELECLDINKTLSIIKRPNAEDMEFWNKMSTIYNSTF